MQERMRTAIRWSVWLCLSLMLWTVAAETTHHHPSRAESTSCSVCVVAHCASPTAGADRTGPVFATIGLLHEEQIVSYARLHAFELGIRGPPAV